MADADTDFLRQVTTNGVVTTFRDASGQRVWIPTPVDVGIHPEGSVLVQSLNSCTIRIFGVGLLAVLLGGGWGTGTGPSGTVYQGSIARVVGIHPDATLQQWARPIVEAVQVLERVDRSLLIADSPANVVRQIAPAGSVITLAGVEGQYGHSDGSGGSVLFIHPNSESVDRLVNLYIADEFGSMMANCLKPS